ncbi:MAG: PAS domain S-box protein, partial [Cyclobacteriaceae bacterium]
GYSFQSIFDNSPLGIFRSVPAGNYVRANQALADMLGYESPKDLIGSVTNIATDIYKDKEQRKEVIELLSQGEKNKQYHCILKRSDGSEFAARVSLWATRNRAGDIDYFEGIVEDVTAFVENEIRIQRSEAWFRHLYEEMPVLIYSVDKDGTLLNVNKKWIQETGYAKDESVGRKQTEFVSKEGLDTFKRIQTKLWKKGSIKNSNLKFVHKNGEILDLNTQAVIIQDIHGENISLVVCENITHRLKTARSLKGSENLLQSVLSNSPDIVMIYEIKQNSLTFINKPEYLGYTRKDLKGKLLDNLLFDNRKEEIYSKLKAENSAEEENSVPLLMRIQRHDFAYEWIENRYALLDDDRLLITSTITTKANIAKLKLAESEARYRTLIEALPDITIISDLKGKIEYVSPQVIKMDGLEPEHYIDTNILDWVIGDQHAQAKQEWINLLEGNAPSPKEFKINLNRGENFIGEIRSTLLLDGNGKPNRVISIIRDTTRTRKMLEDLRESEEKFRSMAENSPDLIWMCDTDFRFIYISPAIDRMLGYSVDEMMDLKLGDIILPSQLNELDDLKLKLTEANKSQKVFAEFRQKRRDNTYIWTEVHFSAMFNSNGQLKGFTGITQDITQRKLSDGVLRESQELYRSLIEFSPEGICIVIDQEVKFANMVFAEIVGAKNDFDVIGKKMLDFIHPDYHEFALNRRDQVLEKERSNEPAFMTYQRLDGVSIEVEVTSTPILFNGRKGAQIIIRDLTDKIRAQRELERERELMDTLIMSVPDVIYFKDLEHKFIKVNKAFAKNAGFEHPEELVGKTDLEIFGEKHFTQSAAEEKKIINTGEPLISEYRVEKWKSKTMWGSVTKMPLLGPNHDVIGTFGITRDISDQKEYEEQLKSREEHFRKLFDLAPIGMCIVNLESEVLRFNNAITEILGYSPSEMLGMNLDQITWPDDAAHSIEMFEKLASGKIERYTIEKRYVKKDEMPVYVILQVVRLSEANLNDSEKYLCQIVDIHDRKTAEEELRIRNNELTNFVYKVSHDLRAPLSSVKGLIQLSIMEKEPAMWKKYTEMIGTRVDRLDSFIKDILSHSRNLYTEINITKVDIASIISFCFSQMTYHPNYPVIEQIVEADDGEFYSDEQRLNEIMRNLISNAIIYSRKSYDKSFVKVTVEINEKWCTIQVEDNGLGIEDAFKERVFEMFYRANDIVEGSGIGLYIVQQSALKLGGSASLESKVNKGTSFTVRIPNKISDFQ